MQRRIVGIGDALLAERGGTITPAGLAVEVALWAARCGHVGIPISRLGQDNRARLVIDALREQEIDVSHLQSDPDLPTARLLLRMVAGRPAAGSARIDERAAFDNMQWDFDLVDVAQEADAVVFGMAAQRGGMSDSVIRRFLSESAGALRMCDLINRVGDDFERVQAIRSMETADVAIVDQAAVAMLLRRSDPPEMSSAHAIQQVLDIGSVAMVVTISDGQPPALHASESTVLATRPWQESVHAAMRMAVLHSQLRGDDLAATASLVDRITDHARDHPETSVPESLLQ